MKRTKPINVRRVKPQASASRTQPWGGHITPPENCPMFHKSFVTEGLRMLDIGICIRTCVTEINARNKYCETVRAQVGNTRGARDAVQETAPQPAPEPEEEPPKKKKVVRRIKNDSASS